MCMEGMRECEFYFSRRGLGVRICGRGLGERGVSVVCSRWHAIRGPRGRRRAG